MKDLVFKSEKGNPVTTSLLIAGKFGKRHSDVLRAIDELLSKLTENECKRNFALIDPREINQPNGGTRKERVFIMTRDGFTLLVMGFTGKEALKFKIEYINAFNQMEQQLKAVSTPANLTRLQLLEMALEAEKKVLSLQPKADYADRVIETENRVDIGQAAKLLKLPFGRNNFFKRLREMGVFFKNRNEPKQEYIERGYFEMFIVVIPTNNHGDLSKTKITVTQKGLFWLAKKFGTTLNENLPVLNAI